MDDTITRTSTSSFSKLELTLEVRALYHHRLQTRQQAESLQTGNMRRCGVMGIACFSRNKELLGKVQNKCSFFCLYMLL